MSNKEIFDKMAKTYDSKDRLMVIEEISRELKKAIKGLPSTKRLVDFGCGTGEIGLRFSEDFDEVFFLDVSQNMLDVVREKLHDRSIENGTTQLIDEETQLVREVDCIIVSQVLLHIPDTKAVIAQLFEMLKENGTLFIVDFDENKFVESDRIHTGFNQSNLIDLLKDTGFSQVNAHLFYERENLLMKQKAALFLMEAHKK